MAKEAYSHVSSTLLRQIATFGGHLDKFLPPEVKDALEATSAPTARNNCIPNAALRLDIPSDTRPFAVSGR